MEVVNLEPRSIEAYVESAGQSAIAELRRLAAPLRGIRVLHINATPHGGGVAEILHSAIPLLRDLGLEATWETITAEPDFFALTNTIHNGLQGAEFELSIGDVNLYDSWQHRNADSLTGAYDLIVVHDPQPLGLLSAGGPRHARWIWRLHVDSSRPTPAAWSFLRPFLAGYDALVFTMPEFIPPDVDGTPIQIIAPAIDPLTPKNLPIPHGRALAILADLGLDPGRPLIAQVSRLDPWKDPTGVIDAFRLVRQFVPGLQLALLGAIAAQDDPEAIGIAQLVRRHASGDPDIHIFVDPARVGSEEVAAVQQNAQVILQKSLREGFGLTVAEALWKATPVVGGRTGGIPLQLRDGVGGFLVSSVPEAADRTRWLLEHPPEARTFAVRGRDHVRENFLITRLLADELRLYADVLGQRTPATVAAA